MVLGVIPLTRKFKQNTAMFPSADHQVPFLVSPADQVRSILKPFVIAGHPNKHMLDTSPSRVAGDHVKSGQVTFLIELNIDL